MKKYSLYDMDSIEFFECIEDLKRDLSKKNKEYIEIQRKIEKIKNKYPQIRGILEDEEVYELTIQESQALLETINLIRDLLRIEQYEIFLLGGRENYEYIKKLEIF